MHGLWNNLKENRKQTVLSTGCARMYSVRHDRHSLCIPPTVKLQKLHTLHPSHKKERDDAQPEA